MRNSSTGCCCFRGSRSYKSSCQQRSSSPSDGTTLTIVAAGVNVTVTGVVFLSLPTLLIDVADDDVTLVTLVGGRSCRVDVAEDALSCDERMLETKINSQICQSCYEKQIWLGDKLLKFPILARSMF